MEHNDVFVHIYKSKNLPQDFVKYMQSCRLEIFLK